MLLAGIQINKQTTQTLANHTSHTYAVFLLHHWLFRVECWIFTAAMPQTVILALSHRLGLFLFSDTQCEREYT
jgi:hypothetical protein